MVNGQRNAEQVPDPIKEESSRTTGQSFLVCIGTYTEYPNPAGGRSKGIYVYRLNPEDGRLTFVYEMKGVINPAFLTFHPSGKYLYTVNEVETFDDQLGGGVSAFSFDPQTGALAPLNHQLSHGSHPCHLSMDATGQFVFAANYSGGNIIVLPVDQDGKLLPATDVVQHHSSTTEPQQYKGSHAHSITLDPTNRFAIAADLGLDMLMVYQFDPLNGKLIPHTWVKVKDGAGPRHLDFHPGGQYAYLINELNATMIAYAYDSGEGILRELQTVPTLPEGYIGQKQCADIHVAPSGKFVYGSNRGHDSIVIYAIDQSSGRLTYAGHQSTQGKTPRNFAIDPSGTFLLAANQDSSTVVTFRIDPDTGKLSPIGQVTKVPAPACIKILHR